MRVRGPGPAARTTQFPDSTAPAPLPRVSDSQRAISGGDDGCSPNRRRSRLSPRPQMLRSAIHAPFPLPVQSRRDSAAFVRRGSEAVRRRPSPSAHARQASLALRGRARLPQNIGHVRGGACAVPANGVRPGLWGPPSGWGSGACTTPPRPPSTLTPPNKREEVTTFSRSTEAGFFSAPFLLPRKRLAGVERKRRDKLPRVQCRHWNREMRRSGRRCVGFPPEPCAPLRFLLRLRVCCYLRTWPGWYWVSAAAGGRARGPAPPGGKTLGAEGSSPGGEALGLRLPADSCSPAAAPLQPRRRLGRSRLFVCGGASPRGLRGAGRSRGGRGWNT